MKPQEDTARTRSSTNPRATRFEIMTAVWYRIRGESSWREGLLKNFSISGMLFVADHPIEKGTNIEMRFTLPVELKDRFPADVCCRGTVVRSEEQAKLGSAIHIAAKILHSHLIRHSEET